MASNFTFMAAPEVRALNEKYQGVLQLTERLPDQVFGERYKWFYVATYDWVLAENCWRNIRKNLFPGTGVIFATSLIWKTSENDSNACCYEFLDAIKLPPSIDSKEFPWAFQYDDGGIVARALVDQSTNLWFSDSMNWAIWGDRDFEMCILACTESLGAGGKTDSIEWLPMTKFLELPQDDGSIKLEREIWDRLMKNYKNLSTTSNS